jgi:formate transporter
MTTQAHRQIDALGPADVARRLEAANVQRAGLSTRNLILLGVLGGLYIGFGGALATLALTDSSLGYGPARLAGGLAFSLGLIMLVLAGGELYTGNNLMVLAYASRKISARDLLRNWAIAYGANAFGAIVLAIAIHLSGVLDPAAVKRTAMRIAEGKAQLAPGTAFVRGVLCNFLVCLAVWLSAAARSVEGKVIAIAFPISAFVALGFEHSIANFYLLTVGLLSGAAFVLIDAAANVVMVTAGNTLGGVLVAVAYYLVYLSANPSPEQAGEEQSRGAGLATPAVAEGRGTEEQAGAGESADPTSTPARQIPKQRPGQSASIAELIPVVRTLT